MYKFLLAGLRATFIIMMILGASKASSQDISGCLCAMLKDHNQDNSIERIRAGNKLVTSDVQEQPMLVAPYIQRYVRNAVADSCSVVGVNSWSGSNLTLTDAILNFGRPVPSAKYTQCIGEADSRYRTQMYGSNSLAVSILNSVTNPPSSQELPSSSTFLNQSILIQSPQSGRMNEASQIFAADVLNSHRYFSDSSATLPEDSIVRLAPWAFPQWPSGMTVQDMTMGAFLEMVNPQSFSFEGTAMSFEVNDDALSWDSKRASSDWTTYTSNAAQLSRYYSSDLNDYLLTLSNGELLSENETRPNASNGFEHARGLLCGQQPSLEMSATVQNLNNDLFQSYNPTIAFGSALVANGFENQFDYKGCLQRCGDPLLNYGPDCMTSCLLPEEDAAPIDGPSSFQGSGVCENMNATYRDACLRNLAAERDRTLQICEMRFGINPNAPDHLNFGVLNSIEDCQAFSEVTAYNCRRYFEERGLGIHLSSSSNEDTARQCVARYCGAYATDDRDTFEQREEEIRRKVAKARELREAIENQIEVSKEERSEIVIPAIQSAAKEHSDTYVVTFGRSQPSEGTSFPSEAHLYGAAQDLSVSRTDGSPLSPEDYETIASSIAERLPDGFQVISEVRIDDTFPSGLNVESISPAEVSYSYTPLVGIDTDRPMITVPVSELGVRYLHSGKANTPNGVQEFFNYGRASGNHIHVGRPSRSLPNF
jgi:uncharacterized protein YjaG (DUF416 family)